jgi:hypothetical protein
MKLVLLKSACGDASSRTTIRCVFTGQREKWNDASARGWMVDRDGIPFAESSYYSPERLRSLNPVQE